MSKGNRSPDTSGISRYWKPGEDDRTVIHGKCGEVRRSDVDAVLSALLETVCERRRTKIVGFGAFEWKPWRNRIPTGKFVETWRLAFKPSRYIKERYDGTDR